MPRPVRTLAIAVAGAAIIVGAAACGSDDGPTTVAAVTTPAATTAASPATTAPAATTPAAAEGPVVKVGMGSPQPFSLTLDMKSVKAGKVTFTVANTGSMPHQLVVLKTTEKANALPMASGTVAKETGKIGGIPDIAAGATSSVTLPLTPGHYSVICNLPGHYKGGMYADLTVT